MAVCADGSCRWPAADALRTLRVAGPKRGVQATDEPPGIDLGRSGQFLRQGGVGGLSARAVDLPTYRAPFERHHEPLAAVAGGITAGTVLRAFPRTCSRTWHSQHRLGEDQHA